MEKKLEGGAGSFNPVGRFDKRADYYSKYRPDYPEELLSFLETELGLTKEMTLVEIGSGTGMFIKHLLETGYKVTGVEPNKEMRDFSSRLLASYDSFKAVDATAEHTTLDSQSVDRIFVAQSFHWFDHEKTRIECQRILKPGGKIAVFWMLHNNQTEFEKSFEKLRQQFAINAYPVIRNDEEKLKEFFLPKIMEKKTFYFTSALNFEALKGLLLSTSFIPQEGHANYGRMLEELVAIFNKYSVDGLVELGYRVPLYWNS